MSIKHYVCVCILALVTRHANRIFNRQHYNVVCGLSEYTIFVPIISQTARLLAKKLLDIRCVSIFSATFV
jgi:hypothetical protein